MKSRAFKEYEKNTRHWKLIRIRKKKRTLYKAKY